MPRRPLRCCSRTKPKRFKLRNRFLITVSLLARISILTHKKRGGGNCILQMFPVFPPFHEKKSRQDLDCNRGIYMYSMTGKLSQFIPVGLENLLHIEIFRKEFLLCYSMNYRDFSVKSKLIISLFQTVKLSL